MRQKSQLKNSLSLNHAPTTPDHESGPSNQRLVLTNNGSRLVFGMGDKVQLWRWDLFPRMKILVITDVSVFRFYEYIGDIISISLKLLKTHENIRKTS